MKTNTTSRTLVCLLALLGWPAIGVAAFNSGSTGAYGPMNITTSTTLAMPDDGIFHCTTVNVATGATLTFTPNARNTPVYILATGDISIAGAINVDGKAPVGQIPGEGGPGGYRGGYPNVANLNGSHGLGPGGSAYNGGTASFYGVYGNAACIPLVGGSGGGGYNGGGGTGGSGGGGAILLASNTKIIFSGGSISSRPTSGNYYEGSSGAIRLVTPQITGTGSVLVNGTGRIRVDTEDRTSWRTVTYASVPGFSYGTRMAVFPGPVPRLDITEVGGTAIPEGTAAPVLVTLPPGSPTSQNVKVKVTNLTGTVNIDVAVVPENGARTVVTTPVDMGGGGTPITITVAVTLPVGIRCAIEAYKK